MYTIWTVTNYNYQATHENLVERNCGEGEYRLDSINCFKPIQQGIWVS